MKSFVFRVCSFGFLAFVLFFFPFDYFLKISAILVFLIYLRKRGFFSAL